MSATLPPAANLDRPSDFGEFWQHAEAAPRPLSVVPEPEAEVVALPLTAEQQARRARFRRAVSGIVLGLFAFTALATCVYVVRRTASRSAEESSAPASVAPREAQVAPREAQVAPREAQVAPRAEVTRAPSPPSAAPAIDAPRSETDQAFSLARTPVATVANLQTWARVASQLSAEDRKRVEHDLSRSSVTGPRATQEAARLELALLWRATARRAKAQKVLVSLARTATDPVVKKYARDTLATA